MDTPVHTAVSYIRHPMHCISSGLWVLEGGEDEFHDKRASARIVYINFGLWDLYILILYNHYY